MPVGGRQRSEKTEKGFAKFKELPPPKDENYNGWTNWDTWNANLILENDESSYNWLQRDWRQNFERKIKNNKFDCDAARYAVYKYIVPVARGKGMINRFPGLKGSTDPDINPKRVDYGEMVNTILGKERCIRDSKKGS